MQNNRSKLRITQKTPEKKFTLKETKAHKRDKNELSFILERGLVQTRTKLRSYNKKRDTVGKMTIYKHWIHCR